jgi:hypothetical protein
MKIHVTLKDGTSKTLDIDVTSLSDEQLDIYASMGADEAVDELKNRIGFNPHKPLEDMTDKDVNRYTEFLEAKQEKDNNER